jgi:hypothetical protein
VKYSGTRDDKVRFNKIRQENKVGMLVALGVITVLRVCVDAVDS